MNNEVKEHILNALKKAGPVKKYFREPEMGKTCGMLSRDELKYIIAFSEVIYHSSNTEEKKKLHAIVSNWANKRTGKDGYLNLFQQGIKVIKHQTNAHNFDKSFYHLSVAERAEILDKPEYMRSDMYNSPGFGNPLEALKFVSSCIINHKQNRNLFFLETLRKDLIRGIFNSELGWELVGYKSWPGVEGDYLSYTKPPKMNKTKTYSGI